jgi:hypothetical protein
VLGGSRVDQGGACGSRPLGNAVNGIHFGIEKGEVMASVFGVGD